MCIEYIGLNKACPKDPFPLPWMKGSDQEMTSFITPSGAFCYIMMPFWLKNVGITYQRTMQKCLHDQIGINV